MNLCIDQGNTRAKIALFEGDELMDIQQMEVLDTHFLESYFEENEIKKTILSTVKPIDSKAIDFLEGSCEFVEFTHETKIPVENLYETPETLGKDRLAGIVGAYSLLPENDVLVIDAGTAVTYDFISADAKYHGGTIAPGLSMRLSALNHFTDKLPLVPVEGAHPLLGKTTEEAIRSGVVNGMIFEMEQYIFSLQEKYPNLITFLTGGDCFFFEQRLKSRIFANENLVLIGLNKILMTNFTC